MFNGRDSFNNPNYDAFERSINRDRVRRMYEEAYRKQNEYSKNSIESINNKENNEDGKE